MAKTFMIFTNTDFWEDPPRARHQVAEALSKKNKVYFISANKIGLPNLTRDCVKKNLVVVIPYFPIDYRIRYRISFINRIYQAWLFRLLSEVIIDENIVVINFDNTATQIFDYAENVIYFCNDYNIRYYYLESIKRYFRKCERIIAEKSKLCVATSEFLINRLKKYNKNVLELRLGSPYVIGDLVFSRNGTIKIGLVGFFLHERRISVKLIRELVLNSNVELYIYGSISKKLGKIFQKYENIKVRGIVKGNSLISELKQIDVGIAPYRIEDVNPGGTPNKLWLYLAVGKPVVISNLPSIKDWHFSKKFIYTAKNDADFVAKVFDAYQDDNRELMESRAEFAKDNSWNKRIDELVNSIDEALD